MSLVSATCSAFESAMDGICAMPFAGKTNSGPES